MFMPSVFLLWDLVTVTDSEIHLQLEPTMRHRQVKKHHISPRYHRMPNPFAVAMVPKDKIPLSSHRRVINTLLHLNNNSLLKDLSILLEHPLHLNIPELPRVPWTNSALHLIRTMEEVNLAHPSQVDNLWEAPW